MILLDTSALYALTVPTDEHHRDATRTLARIQERGEDLVTHTYVLAETFALLHRRHGLRVALKVSDETSSVPTVVVDRALHDRGAAWLRSERPTRASLVDAVSFVVMADRAIESAFAFAPDFEAAGFRLYAPPP